MLLLQIIFLKYCGWLDIEETLYILYIKTFFSSLMILIIMRLESTTFKLVSLYNSLWITFFCFFTIAVTFPEKFFSIVGFKLVFFSSISGYNWLNFCNNQKIYQNFLIRYWKIYIIAILPVFVLCFFTNWFSWFSGSVLYFFFVSLLVMSEGIWHNALFPTILFNILYDNYRKLDVLQRNAIKLTFFVIGYSFVAEFEITTMLLSKFIIILLSLINFSVIFEIILSLLIFTLLLFLFFSNISFTKSFFKRNYFLFIFSLFLFFSTIVFFLGFYSYSLYPFFVSYTFVLKFLLFYLYLNFIFVLMYHKNQILDFYLFVLFSSLVLLFLFFAISTTNILHIFLFLEISNIFLIFSFIEKNSINFNYALLQYLIFNVFLGIWLLLGVALIFLYTGTFDYVNYVSLTQFITIFPSFFFFFLFFFFQLKLYILPIHYFIIQNYEYFSYHSIFFLLIFPTFSFFFIYFKLILAFNFYFYFYFRLVAYFSYLLSFFFLLTLLSQQTSLKTFLVINSAISNSLLNLIIHIMPSSQCISYFFYFFIIYGSLLHSIFFFFLNTTVYVTVKGSTLTRELMYFSDLFQSLQFNSTNSPFLFFNQLYKTNLFVNLNSLQTLFFTLFMLSLVSFPMTNLFFIKYYFLIIILHYTQNFFILFFFLLTQTGLIYMYFRVLLSQFFFGINNQLTTMQFLPFSSDYTLISNLIYYYCIILHVLLPIFWQDYSLVILEYITNNSNLI